MKLLSIEYERNQQMYTLKGNIFQLKLSATSPKSFTYPIDEATSGKSLSACQKWKTS